MKPLPALNQDTVIELAREGGFAFIPKLAGQRRIALADITPEQRQRLNQLLDQALPYAQEEGQPDSPGCGDQRYFRVQISYSSQTLRSEIVLLIPESSAPQALIDLWKTGQVDE
ncbi:protealysin inhibitor emfourin [Pseudomonas lundensis]|uniref:protealysin inhibitor emfourin n=1 Tax=Serratia proteamaculans TaxID=28151 RepID=UPI0029813784|nr:protealysin inhibitor emfourin [Serratia proteamaculans]MDW5502239.1 protealysin inhibitor emfourin [Serratia proteamaculans]MDW5507297.1 protealysin inhibitor emfourin [Pseudomonas lundensis]